MSSGLTDGLSLQDKPRGIETNLGNEEEAPKPHHEPSLEAGHEWQSSLDIGTFFSCLDRPPPAPTDLPLSLLP
jgi:hypothetical protein